MFFTANGANRPHLPPLGAMRAVSLFHDRHRMERRGTGRSASPLLLPMQGGNAFVSRKWQSGTRRLCGSLRHASGVRPPGSPFQQTGSKRYTQQEALNNGTLFPGLNLPFHLKADARNVVNSPLAELQALEFVLVELGLYLDTHSGDAEAFELYKQYAALEKEAREKYEAANGPLFQRSTANSKTWNAWLSDPWPWNYQEGAER